MGIDHYCNATAVWEESDGVHTLIKSSTLPYGGTWSTPCVLSNPEMDSYGPRIAVDRCGGAVCVWVAYSGSSYVMQSASYVLNENWSRRLDVSTFDETVHGLQIAADALGNVIAVWVNNGVVQVSSLSVGSTWTSPRDLSPPEMECADPQVAQDTLGNAIVVFQGQNEGVQIYASRFLREGSWSSPVALSDLNYSAKSPSVSIDCYGDAVAMWEISNEHNRSIQSAYYLFGEEWSLPITASSDDDDCFDSSMVQDGFGNTTAVWSCRRGSHVVIQSAHIQKRSLHWSLPRDISTQDGYAYDPKIAIDGIENIFASWDVSLDEGIAIQVAHFHEDKQWSKPINISNIKESAISCQIATSPRGIGVLVWNNLTKTQIEAVSFSPSAIVSHIVPNYSYINGGSDVDIYGINFINVKMITFGGRKSLNFKVMSPTSIRAKVPSGAFGDAKVSVITESGESKDEMPIAFTYKKPRRPKKSPKFFGIFKKRQNNYSKKMTFLLTSWKKSPSPDIAYYKIYHNGKLLRTIPSTDPLAFRQECRSVKNINRKLVVTAVAASGLESRPTKLQRYKKDKKGIFRNPTKCRCSFCSRKTRIKRVSLSS